jgi:hypothetical protein
MPASDLSLSLLRQVDLTGVFGSWLTYRTLFLS